jgi:vacuolar-type H+-ATPase subunit I/STV1
MILSKIMKLFKKESKKIIRTFGGFYAGIGAWCSFGLFLLTPFKNLPEDDELIGFNKTLEILQSNWSTYMPLLIIIGLGMIVFSYLFDRLNKYKVAIQTGILIVSIIWITTYLYSAIPFLESFKSISPEQESFTSVSYVLNFAFFFALLTIPNYIILKKLKVDETDR